MSGEHLERGWEEDYPTMFFEISSSREFFCIIGEKPLHRRSFKGETGSNWNIRQKIIL